MLAWVLERFHYRRRLGLTVSTADPVAADRFIAMATLTRTAVSHAQAILAMSRKGVAESGYVNVRAMLEIWADFRLLRNDTSELTFQSMYLAGALALLRKTPDASVERGLQRRFGAAFQTAQTRMTKRPFAHWSGSPRKSVVEAQCGPIYGHYYELLSWDSHPVVQVALDVQELDRKEGKYQLRHRVAQGEVVTQNCLMATHIVRDMWNELVKHQPL
jgi:hypothetical protein